MTNSNVELVGSGRNILAKSTGPRTAEGKRRTKHNAIRHGIFANLVLTDQSFQESLPDYKKLLDGLCDAIKPCNALDQALVEALAFEFLRLSRIYRADAQIAPRMFERVHTGLVQDSPQFSMESVDKQTEIVLVQRTPEPELLIRYGSSVTKHIHRILDRIERMERLHNGPGSIPKKA
jgi:hypothetical protein